MAKSKKAGKSSIKVKDLRAKKNPKGGVDGSVMPSAMGDGSVRTTSTQPTESVSLNFTKITYK